jgi:hypothetical protein
MIYTLIFFSSLAHSQEPRQATLNPHAIICTAEGDIYHLINLFQKQNMSAIEKYMRPGKCAMTNRSNNVLVLDYVAGRPSMSSTLEIIHKYHIISAQISAWEKPF